MSTPSDKAIGELQSCASRIRPAISAERLWERILSPEDRQRLGGDLETAYRRLGTAGMWAELRGVGPQRAVLDVAQRLGFLRDEDYRWLLRETGEMLDVEEALSEAVARGHFVLVEQPRAAHWKGTEIEIDWNKFNVLWEFVWELGRHSKAGQPIDRFAFGENAGEQVVTQRKSRLTNIESFPADLAGLIEAVGRGSQKLNLPAERIRLYESSGPDTLQEWHP